MIKFQDLNGGKPYIVFKRLYDEAEHRNQKSLDAVAISSFDKNKDEVDSRFVNLKFLESFGEINKALSHVIFVIGSGISCIQPLLT